MPLSRAQKKFLAIERAKHRLRQRLETIDWELDELQGKLDELRELEQSQNLEIEMGDGSTDQD